MFSRANDGITDSYVDVIALLIPYFEYWENLVVGITKVVVSLAVITIHPRLK